MYAAKTGLVEPLITSWNAIGCKQLGSFTVKIPRACSQDQSIGAPDHQL